MNWTVRGGARKAESKRRRPKVYFQESKREGLISGRQRKSNRFHFKFYVFRRAFQQLAIAIIFPRFFVCKTNKCKFSFKVDFKRKIEGNISSHVSKSKRQSWIFERIKKTFLKDIALDIISVQVTEVSVERLFSNLAPERTPINMASEHLVFAVEHKKGKQSNKNVLLLFPPCLYGQIKITWVFWTKTVPKNSILLYIPKTWRTSLS